MTTHEIQIAEPRPPDVLRAHVRAGAENRPAVYRMIGPGDAVLYVGKSIRVRTRLLSYFRARRGEKAEEIIRNTHRIEWQYVPSEFAAVLLEVRSIKQWRPTYNVAHRGDRSYCFIRMTREEAPRLQAVPAVRGDGAHYYGPFYGPDRVRSAVREIADLLELRDCASRTPLRFADQLDLFNALDRVPLCLRGDVHRCLAPCAGRCTRSEYLSRAEMAMRFMAGEEDAPLDVLRSRMDVAAERLQFEYAASLRDRLEALKLIRDELLGLRSTIEALTFVYPVRGFDGDDRVYIIRRGIVVADQPAPRTGAEQRALNEKADRLCRGQARHPFGIGPAEAGEILTVARWFRLRPEERHRAYRGDDPEFEIPVAV